MPLAFARSAIVLPMAFAAATLPPVRRSAFLTFRGAGRDQRHTIQVVDHLYINVVQRAIDIESRTLGRAQNFLRMRSCTAAGSYFFLSRKHFFFSFILGFRSMPGIAWPCFDLATLLWLPARYFAPVLPTFFFRRSPA